ncbi:thioesterase family protein [Burkholderia pseudomultivorans]|uniref:Thioesterase n=2 Tax=Burkholderia pseudomultivorans TaxID=1207504 RepID=A0A132EI19_9BURK|nr:hotdog domain-containing protein [Burkholderia pseudomultivorans]KWF30197.1 thioesterase [Burkholderia pseudomultivorans]MDR8727122.1 Fluoroacetyl-CoA thioesterase [Burkholderia pseudomultivorans]MDR8733038.1 Fluoroacetyl-CoA thioesterase [Burkholderia pseudomultivorans]MDR8739905.1 Fluoroacetyl-CoA thioesterase [Burkholderia pseudomultivorans]MDR8756013.1 Fluoroacetyl-CoA thioesterase [Burkholderia pseudomultivorans]
MISSGATVTLKRRVGVQDLASAFGNGSDEQYPDVMSTPAMLALMERACAEIMRGELGDGQLSVGVTTRLTHSAPTPIDAEVRATARFRGQEDKLFVFDVVVHDTKGEVGSGTHARAIVGRAAIETKAAARR